MRIPTFGLVALIGCQPLFLWPSVVWSDQGNIPVSQQLAEELADPSLGAFVQTVIDANPRVRASQAALEASKALESAAGRPLYNPELEADYENAVDQRWEIGIGQTFDWSGKRGARSAVATSDRNAMEAQFLATRRELAVELLSGLTQYQTGVQRETLAAERVQVMQDFADLAQRRFEAGDLNQVETDLANLASMDAKIQRATAAAKLAEARQAVRNIVQNATPDQWPSIDSKLPLITAFNDPQSTVLALPEVQVAQRRVDAANALVELRERERKPDPTVQVRGGREADSTLVGVNLSIPLYIRNSYKYEVTAAMAERDQVQQLADDLMRRAYSRYLSATERYQLSRDAWQDWQQTGQFSLQRQGDLLRRLWEAGEISTTDFLVQVQQTLDTRENALDLELAMWNAWFEWLAASGQVDKWLGKGGAL
jgi:outer membrane protein, heavy metal efflux system